VTIEGGEGAAEGAAGETTNVTHAFQPDARFSASNPYRPSSSDSPACCRSEKRSRSAVVKGREEAGKLFANFVKPHDQGGLCGMKFTPEQPPL
jgi:hypothetical protein